MNDLDPDIEIAKVVHEAAPHPKCLNWTQVSNGVTEAKDQGWRYSVDQGWTCPNCLAGWKKVTEDNFT